MKAMLPLLLAASAAAAQPVATSQDAGAITLSNGLLSVVVSRSDGSVKSIRQCGADGCRDLGMTDARAAYDAPGDDAQNDFRAAMYWDANADLVSPPAGLKPLPKGYFRIGAGQPEVALVSGTPQRAEVAVRVGATPLFPLDVEYHYVMFEGQSGFYAYAQLHHGAAQPAVSLAQNRFVIKTVMDGTFTHWATGGGRFVPIPQAAVAQKVSDATFLLEDGTVKTKYMNSVYWSEVPVYGYVGPGRGLWTVEASPDYHNGGPVKQGQTVHDNVLLRVLQSNHFGASNISLAAGEEWRKVYGPFLVYANRGASPEALWDDAVRTQQAEAARWPYRWMTTTAYARERGEVRGKVQLEDGPAAGAPAAGAWAILSDPKVAWTEQNKGYAHWARVAADGSFTIANVVPGDYALHVSGADQPRDFTLPNLHVHPGKPLQLGSLRWSAAPHGERLWQIGRFDRSAAEYRNGSGARQFEMYRAYPVQFPQDVDFTIGRSSEATDWNYAHWAVYSRRPDWRIHFTMPRGGTGKATLTLGFASSQPSRGRKLTDLRIRVNGTEVAALALPKTGTAGYRGSVQDSPYNLREIAFDAALLTAGENVISLAHADARPFADFAGAIDAASGTAATPGQVMYDALRLELERAPAQ